MVSQNPLAVVARSILALALLGLAAAMAGCADYDVGPDPSPWNPRAETGPQGAAK